MVKSFQLTTGLNRGPFDCKPSTLPLDRVGLLIMTYIMLLATCEGILLHPSVYLMVTAKHLIPDGKQNWHLFWSWVIYHNHLTKVILNKTTFLMIGIFCFFSMRFYIYFFIFFWVCSLLPLFSFLLPVLHLIFRL